MCGILVKLARNAGNASHEVNYGRTGSLQVLRSADGPNTKSDPRS